MAHSETAYIGDTGKGRNAQRQALKETLLGDRHTESTHGVAT